MKRLSLISAFLCLIILASGQTDSAYKARLFYTCKVWGYLKYFHSEVADCNIDWDDSLLVTLPEIKNATNNTAFNEIMMGMIEKAGQTAIPSSPPPVIPDSLMTNLDTDWFDDPVFSDNVREALDTIQERFRPRSHCLVSNVPYVGNPVFDEDDQYYSSVGMYPDEEVRILSLFRYWNIINYFFPYKSIMDQDWDSTLLAAIPWFVEAENEDEYGLAVKKLTKRINDSHAFTSGGTIGSYFGNWYPDFAVRIIEDETVITACDTSIGVRPGDIIREIDGLPVGTIRDSLWEYAQGSNDISVDYYVNDLLIRGAFGDFEIAIENDTGLATMNLTRNHSYQYIEEPGPVWYDTIIGDGCFFGYVDMAQLVPDEVEAMMADLWNTDALVFDIRNYPQGTLWTLVYYLFTEPLYIANFTVPDVEYPGTHSWVDVSIGGYSSDIYQGNILILFDERTISQAEYTCMGLEQFPGATKIGSTTRAADGNVSQIKLPGYITTIMTGLGTYYPDYSPTQRTGILPDIEVWPTIQGFREGRDEILELAFDCQFTGQEEMVADESFIKAYPNPFQNELEIYSPKFLDQVHIEICDLSGRLVFTKEERMKSNVYSMNLAFLARGTYLLSLSSDNMRIMCKIVKQ